MNFRWVFIIGCLSVIAACGDNQRGALKRAWNKAQKTDTQEAYMAYMGERGFATDLAHPVDEKKLHQEYFDRRNDARSRIFEIGLESVRGSSPFKSLYVDLR